MASLKPKKARLIEGDYIHFHGRKIMASLKPLSVVACRNRYDRFPWSKDHGLIEAPTWRAGCWSRGPFPWSKDHGLIEASLDTSLHPSRCYFHGRKIMASLKRRIKGVDQARRRYFHGRKIMASLKRGLGKWAGEENQLFPWSKDHGLIEARPTGRFHLA